MFHRPLRLSASSKNTYVSCQRKFWHQCIGKTDKDADYFDPEYFIFGRVFAECLEIFKHSFESMDVETVQRICKRHALKETSTAKILACLRSYFHCFPVTDVRACELWIENKVLRGKIDAVAVREGSLAILENKTASEISSTLPIDLKIDPQICLYTSQIEEIKAKLKLDLPFEGVLYRVTEKPKERQKVKESFLEYAARCKAKTEEFFVPFKSMAVEQVLKDFKTLLSEITAKGADHELFAQNTRECVKYHQACPYYSRCHGMMHCNAKLEDDSSIDF
jgi:hypothetical protein